MNERFCVICSSKFQTDKYHPNALTCSKRCNELRMNQVRKDKRRERGEPKAKKCLECGEIYTPSKYAWHKSKYCSVKCASRVAQRKYVARNRQRSDPRLRSRTWEKLRKEIRERDNNECQICGSGYKLNVHHIFYATPDDENNNSSDNLVTLCGKCHYRIHRIGLSFQNGKVVISGLALDFLGIGNIEIAKR